MKIGDLVTIKEEVMGCRPRIYLNNHMGIIIALRGDVCSVSFIGTDEVKSFYVQDVEVIK